MDVAPPQPTPKAQRTRQRILAAALRLFAERGYEGTTMRDIAAAADCSLGLTYRYFASKEDLALEFYHWLVGELVAQVEALPAGTLAERFDQLMMALLGIMAPHRLTLAALFGAALNPLSRAGLFGAGGAAARRRARDAYATVVTGATDAPRRGQVDELATLLYGAQLAMVVFWLQDMSAGAAQTRELIALMRDGLQRARVVLRLPWGAQLLTRMVRVVGPMLGHTPPATG
jgi:AcrR family transcriptional regulator